MPKLERFEPDLGRSSSYELLEPWEARKDLYVSARPSVDGAGPGSVSEVFGVSSEPDQTEERSKPEIRRVYINNPMKTSQGVDVCGNKVRTSKYTILSFLPKKLV